MPVRGGQVRHNREVMAPKTLVVLHHDFDGGPADQTITFGLDGVSYEIDLCDTHAESCARPFTPTPSPGGGCGPAARR